MTAKPEIASIPTKGITYTHASVDDSVQSTDEKTKRDKFILTNDESVDTNFQHGVQNIEAISLSWDTKSLLIVYLLIWVVYFVQGLVGGISGTLLPYITSDFAMHSLTATTGVVSAVVGGVTNLSIAKVLDVFGRPQGFLLCSILATLGLIMSAACNNVEAYAASQVFYAVGVNGIGYTLSVFLADTTSLQNRGLVQSLCASPGLITAWLGGPISTSFLNGVGWRWAFGIGSILVPAVTLPLCGLFMYHSVRAKKQGVLSEVASGRSPLESLTYYAREFDLLGLLLLSAGIAFLLLPFNLYLLQAKGWGSPLVISFLVVGTMLLVAFGVWERYSTSVPFISWRLIKDRTVAGACVLSFILFVSNSCWALYLSSILQVVNGLSVTRASYIVQIQSVAGPIFAILTGAIISHTKRFKPITLHAALPVLTLGYGLLIYFREPNTHIGYLIMCMLFIALGGGCIMVTDEIAILAAVREQQHFAVAIALISMLASVGSAAGLTISSAIWQNVLPNRLARYLPPEDLPNLAMIYSDITTQLLYPIGSPTRLAIQRAYGDAQMLLFTAATACMVLGFAGTTLWRNADVSSMKQTKGRVF